MNKVLLVNSKITFLFTLGVIIPAIIILIMKRTYEYKREELEKLNKDLEIINFVHEVSTELFSVEYSLKFVKDYDTLPTIYVITAVNNSVVTKLADINRFSNTLRLVPKLTWIIVEDSVSETVKMRKFLQTLDMPNIVHLSYKSPDENDFNKTKKMHGSYQRNFGIQWLRSEYDDNSIDRMGVVYFAQPEHSYDIRIFEEMRNTKSISVWPIALVKDIVYQAPICSNNKVTDWFCGKDCPSIDFPLNLNGFAVNIELIIKSSNPSFPNDADYEVNDFIKNLITNRDELEPKAEMCSKIYVWNTITAMPNLPYAGLEKKYNINYEEYMLEQV